MGICRVLELLLASSWLMTMGCSTQTDTTSEGTTSTTTTTSTIATSTTTATTETASKTHSTTTSATTGTTTIATTETVPAPPPVIDCSKIPAKPTSIVQMGQPRAYHGIVFDADNNLVGNDTTHIHRASDPDNSEVWLPGVGLYEQMGRLADGDIVAVSGTYGTVERIASDGSRTVLDSGRSAYGLVVGPDNMVYIADPWLSNTIIRIDPDTGWAEEYIAGFAGNVYAKVIAFNRDYSRMYIGTVSDAGVVMYVDLDKKLEPIGGPQLFATNAGVWHDGLGMDACGNLYVNDYGDTAMYRISEKGQVALYHDFPYNDYGHGHTWGTGVGFWDDHTLYVPQPYIGYRVSALTIGVPAMDWNNGFYSTINE